MSVRAATVTVNQGHPEGPTEMVASPVDEQSLTAALAYASQNASSANPFIVRLLPGTYTITAPLNLPSYTSLIGAGRDATIIQRTVAKTNTTYGSGASVFCDPVVSVVNTQTCSIANLTLQHTGTTDAANSGSTSNPTGLISGGALRLKLTNVRLEGSWVGWYDKTDSIQGATNPVTSGKPIPGDLIGNEDYQFYATNVIAIGHSLAGLHQIARRELFATDCIFMCDIRSTDVISTVGMPFGCNHWEYTVGYYKSCHFIMRSAQTLTFSSGTTDAACAFAIKDTSITDTVAYCDNCTFYLDLGDGNINTTANTNGACAVYVGGNGGDSNGTQTQWLGNIFEAVGCRFNYETGAITSSPYIAGLYLDGQTGVNTAGDARLRSCKFYDVTGSGGTIRANIVIAGRLGNAQPKNLSMDDCGFVSYNYRAVTGSPVWTHANFGYTPDSLNRQRGSVTFATAATAAASLALNYTASGGITDYTVLPEPSAAESFWVTAKTNSGFTMNSSNAASTATVKFVVYR